MKLLIVSTSFPKTPGDSLSPFMWEYCKGLKNLGWDITVLVPHKKGFQENEIWDGITIKRFRYLPEPFETLGYDTGGIIPNLKKTPWIIVNVAFYVFSMYRESLRLTADEDFDLVNFHWIFPSAFWLNNIFWKCDTPIVITGHGTDIHLSKKPLWRFFASKAFKQSSAVTVNSEYMNSILSASFPSNKIKTIPMGIDTLKFTPADIAPSRSKTILYVGRLIKQKGINLLLEAFIEVLRQYPDARLMIIGYGPERDTLKNIIKDSGISGSVEIIDSIEHDKLPGIYRQSRVLALPSLIPEGLGMTVVEAAACSIPSITFGLGGTSELVIDKKSGLIVKPDTKSLAAGIARLMADDGLVDKMGEAARKWIVENYCWNSITDKFDTLFRKIAADAKNIGNKPFSNSSKIIVSSIIVVTVISYLIKTIADRFEKIIHILK